MTRVRDESGFSLVELVVALAIGTVVLLAAFMLVDASTPLAQRTNDRVDAFQRGRLALDIVGAELRSQVCMPGAIPPIMPTVSDEDDISARWHSSPA
jgi:prepilin-type N-terminal cleavage/methylation domain-containing protein